EGQTDDGGDHGREAEQIAVVLHPRRMDAHRAQIRLEETPERSGGYRGQHEYRTERHAVAQQPPPRPAAARRVGEILLHVLVHDTAVPRPGALVTCDPPRNAADVSCVAVAANVCVPGARTTQSTLDGVPSLLTHHESTLTSCPAG